MKAQNTLKNKSVWDRLVNERFGGEHPILSPQESISAARKLYRHGMGKAFKGEVKLTSGNRYTWVRNGVMSVNPDKKEHNARGLRAMIHDISHYCHARLHPKDAPHSARQAALEGKLVDYALSKGFTEGSLRREPPAEKAKPDPVQRRYAAMVKRRDKWAAEAKRAARLHAKTAKEVRAYERRHGARLSLAG